MSWKTGSWGPEAKARSERRKEYFRDRQRRMRNVDPEKYKKQHGRKSLGESMAYKSEFEALKLLQGSKRIYRPCDIDWNGKLVDVKTAVPTVSTSGRPDKPSHLRWKFLLTKQKGKADYFLLLCKNSDKTTKYVFLIPDSEIPCNNLSFSEHTAVKYSKYALAL